jgi:phosphoserine aminotransferase
VQSFYAANRRKAKMLYDIIDQHKDFYSCRIHPDCRSIMNVVFTIKNEALLPLFLEEANQAGLVNLRGHRIAGGLRASIYNAMPEAGVALLVDFMRHFIKKHG